jgi:hypothetical protein
MTLYGRSRHVTSRHVTSRHVTSRHVTSRHVTSRHTPRVSLEVLVQREEGVQVLDKLLDEGHVGQFVDEFVPDFVGKR